MANNKELIAELHNLGDAIEHRQMKVALTMRQAADALEAMERDADKIHCLCQCVERFKMGAKIAAIPTNQCNIQSAARDFADVTRKSMALPAPPKKED